MDFQLATIQSRLTTMFKRYWWALALVILFAWLVIRILAFYASVNDLRSNVVSARESYGQNNVFEVNNSVSKAIGNVHDISSFTSVLAPLRFLPILGEDIHIARELVRITDTIAYPFTKFLFFGASPFDTSTHWSLRGLTPTQYNYIAQHFPTKEDMHSFTERVKSASIDIKKLKNESSSSRFSPWLTLLDAKIDSILPRLTAWDNAWFFNQYLFSGTDTKRILVLMVNEGERRIGGGIVTAYGVLEVKPGSVELVEFNDTYNFDRAHHLTGDNQLRNVLTKEFHEGAPRAQKLVSDVDGKNIDIVLGVTTKFFVDALLHVKGFAATDPRFKDINSIDKRKFVEIIEKEVHVEYRNRGLIADERKELLRALGIPTLGKGEEFTLPQLFSLGDLIRNALVERNILLYSDHALFASDIHTYGWDGVPVSSEFDHLSISDTNTGGIFNKTDRAIEKSYQYEVVEQATNWKSTLHVTYVHHDVGLTKTYPGYRDTVEIGIPGSATLLTHGKGISTFVRSGVRYVRVPVRIRVGHEYSFDVTYTLPKQQGMKYALRWIREPGTADPQVDPSVALLVRLLNPLSEVRSNTPVSFTYGERQFSFAGQLHSDLEWRITTQK